MGIDFKGLLNERQYEACCSTARHLRIVAGAGTGKTRVLTYRIAYLISENEINPSRIVAITFTNKVAKEMEERVDKIMKDNGTPLTVHRPLIATFHGFCYRFLRRECALLKDFNSQFSVADDEMQKELFKHVFLDLHIPDDKDIRSDITKKIGFFKNKGIFPDEVNESMFTSSGPATPKEIIDCYKKYQSLLKKNNSLDFDDLLMYTAKILDDYPEVRERWHRKFDAYLIDEFQDTDSVQYKLVKHLLSSHTSLTVVGDPDQTIYTWRGADSNLIQNSLPKDFPDLQTVTLDLNYRSTQQILDKANMLIKFNSNRLDKSLRAFNEEEGKDVTFTPCNSSDSEASLVINKILELHRNGVEYKDIVIIYRSNYLSQPFEHALTRNKIPYAVYGGLKFYDRAEIKDALAYMKLLVNPKDDYSFFRVLKAPSRGIGAVSYEIIKETANRLGKSNFETCIENLDEIPLKPTLIDRLTEFKTVYDETVNQLKEAKPEEVKDVIDHYLNNIGFKKYINDIDTKEDKNSLDTNEQNTRMKNVRTLIGLLGNYMESDNFDEEGNLLENSLEEFLIDAALQSAQDEIKDNNKVLLMTAHVSKGLEFPYVFVVCLDENIFPTGHAIERGNKGIEEERRLCYVAITRAKKQLFLSSQGGYSFATKGYNTPSQFVKEIGFNQEAPKPSNSNDLYNGGGRGFYKSNSYSNDNKHYSKYNGYFSSNSSKFNSNSTPKTQNVVYKASSSNISKVKAATEVYVIGDKVAHSSFGVGTVIKVEPSIIVVKFPEPYGEKRLVKGFKAFRKVS